MDKNESIHEKDVSNLDFTSTHRLPTISAAQAFDDLKSNVRQFIPTGIEALDSALADGSLESLDEPQRHRGFQKGQVVEVWGPPASGKTTLAMQTTANVLADGCKVVWVDTSSSLCHHRFGEIIGLSDSVNGTTTPLEASNAVANLVHYFTPTLAHFIGLFCKPEASSIPSNTSLIVIDGLSSLVNRAFPKNVERHQNHKVPSPATRRLQVLQSIISTLQKLSATRNILVLVLSQCATRMQLEHGATIVPAINASTWEQGIAARLVLFRDWTTVNAGLRNVRLVGVQKSYAQVNADSFRLIIPFEISNDGLVGLDWETAQASLALAKNPQRQKRKFDETDDEIADSEAENYGWEDEDEAEMPNMPPQWQGSEDLLLGRADEDDYFTVET
ncbi:P-loop containing nucleoside triphosphate hydrolase protein [Xylaria bambusicola]|uniref:P-loop containing nucleoside triphosphate hydrolase protein n=1 Tax=Xylaria bambusicola TaxID=326684 RepID=UPI00200768BB|nr:P-loop containing nucleoside triphosphate hydrolase protein [Xylaria bambusicola]KAI0523631.1 P-loop containing nucleoside triphosphate hydrolase protein [Xylaria bambusicola]